MPPWSVSQSSETIQIKSRCIGVPVGGLCPCCIDKQPSCPNLTQQNEARKTWSLHSFCLTFYLIFFTPARTNNNSVKEI